MRPAISLRGVSKKYIISPSRSSRLGELLSFGKAKRSREFWALQDIDLDVEGGTTLGVVGRNGAGKSTLLSIISGVLRPTTGEVQVEGRLSAIFGLGAGFNPLFTGRENAMLSGLILGIEYEEMIERFDAIEAFADIGEFMDQPIKTYSSGMRSRLGFAVAINVEPDVLVIDEALSAGDSAFKKKAIQRMYDLRDSGSTVLFVSHSMGMVKRFCTQAILMHKGNLVSTGSPEEVVDYYEEMLAKSQEMKDAAQTSELDEQLDEQLDYEIEHEEEEDTPTKGEGLGGRRPQQSRRRVVGGASIVDLEVLDEEGRPAEALPSGATLSVRVHLRYEEAMEESTLGISLQSEGAGVEVFWTDTAWEEAPIGRKEAGEQVKVEFTFEVPLGAGSYNVEASLTDGRAEGTDVARAREARTFQITQQGSLGPVRGLVRVPTKVEISSALEAEEQEGPVRPA